METISGTSFTPADNDEILCTFENEFTAPIAPTLTIEKLTNQNETVNKQFRAKY